MNQPTKTTETERIAAARDSFSGRLLTDTQFDEAIAITGIIEREIYKSGSFKEKLGDYAYAFARTENFDVAKSETILRDLFKARTGQSMNQMREGLIEQETKLPAQHKSLAVDYAKAVGTMIRDGDKISFNSAFAHQAQRFAGDLGITDAGAKRLMREEFSAAERRDFYEWGKEVETQFYRPQIEAEKQRSAPEQSRDMSADRRRSFSRPRP